jgi:amidohydrolase family protein
MWSRRKSLSGSDGVLAHWPIVPCAGSAENRRLRVDLVEGNHNSNEVRKLATGLNRSLHMTAYNRFSNLVRFPNLYLKFSSVNLYAAARGKSNARELFSRLLDCFGASRMMWGSNFPATNDRSLKKQYDLLATNFPLFRRRTSVDSSAKRLSNCGQHCRKGLIRCHGLFFAGRRRASRLGDLPVASWQRLRRLCSESL